MPQGVPILPGQRRRADLPKEEDSRVGVPGQVHRQAGVWRGRAKGSPGYSARVAAAVRAANVERAERFRAEGRLRTLADMTPEERAEMARLYGAKVKT